MRVLGVAACDGKGHVYVIMGAPKMHRKGFTGVRNRVMELTYNGLGVSGEIIGRFWRYN